MRVLVLGANGFIGQAITAYFSRSAGVDLVAAVRCESTAGRIAGVDYRTVDAMHPAALAEAIRGVSHVVNCVMGSGQTMTRSTTGVCEAALRSGVTRVVHFSSCAVYGATTGRIDEQTVVAREADWYGIAKIACESIAADYARRGLSNVVFRPSCIYGPGSEQWTGRIGRLLSSGRLGDLGAAGDGRCNLVYVDDVCAAVLSALSMPGGGLHTFILSGPSPGTWNDYFLAFARALGAVPIRRLPGWRLRAEGKVLAPALKLAQIARSALRAGSVHVPDPLTPSLLRAFELDAAYDGSSAARSLGLGWTPLERGLTDAAAWVARHAR